MAPTHQWGCDNFFNNISHLYTVNIMGRKRDLTTIEKDQIV